MKISLLWTNGAVMEGIGKSGDWKFLYQGKEYIDFNGSNLYDFNSRSYDAYIGRFWQLDGANQFASGYTGMGNSPVNGVDPDGQFWHIVIGAIIGGAFNLGTKAFQGKINSWGDGLAAFGIGAAAGAVTAATGGLAASALGLGSTGILSGAVTGAVGSAVGDPIRGFGNAAYFGDAYTLKDYGTGILAGGVIGGAVGGGAALIKNQNFWNGAPKGAGTRVFTPPKMNAEALKEQGWQRLARGRWGHVGMDDYTTQFPDWMDPNGVTHQGGTYTTNASAAKGGSHLVYEGLDAAGKVRYVGITGRDAAVRFGEHAAAGGEKGSLFFKTIQGTKGLSKTQARIWEQALINQYGLGKNGGQLLNKVNSIAPKNWLKFGIR